MAVNLWVSIPVKEGCGGCLVNSSSGNYRNSASEATSSSSHSSFLSALGRPCSRSLHSNCLDSGIRVSCSFHARDVEEACLGSSIKRRNQQRAKPWMCSVLSPTQQSPETGGNHGLQDEISQEDEEPKKQEKSGFLWKSNWYPIIPVQDIDEAVPHPFQILGRKVVLWYDREFAQWRAFDDSCPHRLAPLSEGRIDAQGCLQCCYHAWSFKGDGSCTRIPQARSDGPEIRAVGKTRATSFPTTVAQGILFIWPDENGFKLAETTSPPITPQHDSPEWEAVATFRDMDYGWDTGMENLLDPSHVPVAHHKVNGGSLGTRDDATPLKIDIKDFNAHGFNGLWSKYGKPAQFIEFEAPARTTYVFSLNGQALGTTTTYVTPTAPGRSRVMVQNGRKMWIMNGKASRPNWWQVTPRWWDHQKMLNLLDGDESLLHGQERQLREVTKGQIGKWNQAFFMPCASDRFVTAFRQWLNRHGGEDVQWAEGVDPKLPPLIQNKEELLDRYESHTKHCKVCSGALQKFKLARQVLFITAAVLVGAAPLLQVWSHRVLAVASAGISGLVAWRLGGWIQMFYYKGYDHARIP